MKPDFKEWMKKVNSIIMQKCYELSSEDLPDYCYYDAWKAGDTPAECAADAIENAKGY